ncbi:DAP3-binding cell death enhancer 1, partial [Varanus komodoensis]
MARSSWHGRNQQRRTCRYGNVLQCYTPLDAFTWSALACLALELAKRVRWLSSPPSHEGDAGIHQLKQRLAVLPQHQRSEPPADPLPCSSEEKEQHFFLGVGQDHTEKNPSSNKISQPKEYELHSETGDFVFPPSPDPEPDPCPLRSQANREDEDSVNRAASQVQQVFQASMSVASNILGLAHMQEGQHPTAFSCFKLAADQNYSKSQFNVGLCYEHGRGTKKDVAKVLWPFPAVLYYRRAALQGHSRAQRRYAKWLLHQQPRTGPGGGAQEAVGSLHQAHGAEQIQASVGQGCSSRFRLAVGHGKGFGAPQSSCAARKQDQQAAAANGQPARASTEATVLEESAAARHCHQLPLVGRTSSSSPCLQQLDRPLPSRVSLGL